MVEMENINGLVHSRTLNLLYSSVLDPNSQRYTSGSGFDSQRYSSGSGSRPGCFHDKANTVRKTLFSAVLWLYDFLLLKNDVNAPTKRNKQNNKFLLASWRSLRKRAGSRAGFGCGSVSPRIRIRTNMSRIRDTVSFLKSVLIIRFSLFFSSVDCSLFIITKNYVYLCMCEFGTIVHS